MHGLAKEMSYIFLDQLKTYLNIFDKTSCFFILFSYVFKLLSLASRTSPHKIPVKVKKLKHDLLLLIKPVGSKHFFSHFHPFQNIVKPTDP